MARAMVPTPFPSAMSVPKAGSVCSDGRLAAVASVDVAAKECEAVRVGSKSKVLAGHADAVGFPALQVTLVDVAPLLRAAFL